MNKTLNLLFVTVAFLMASCAKSDLSRDGHEGKIEFTVQSGLKTYVDVAAAGVATGSQRMYSFVGTKAPSSENMFGLSFQTDSLRPGTYNVSSGVITFREGSQIFTSVNNLQFTVTITSNNGGLVNGTFSGTLYDHTTLNSCSVVNGSIQNIQLSYR